MEHYEDINIFRPVLNTTISLMRSRGQESYCQLVLQAKVSVVNTEYDNWNGGTYGYTVYMDLPVSVYASLKKDEVENIERYIGETLNEVIKGDDYSYFMVQFAPIFTVSDIDWTIIGGENAKNQLKNEIEKLKDIMISVATGGYRIQEVDDEYRKLHTSIASKCRKLSIKYDNEFVSLWDWYGRWRDGLSTYQSRRLFIHNLLQPTLTVFDSIDGNSTVEMPFVELDEWEQIRRVVIKIKRDCNSATNEEDFQQVGLLCREVIISLAQAVYVPSVHGDKDDKGVVIGKTDGVRMIENYLNVKLIGSSNEVLRSYSKVTNKLANQLTHKRNATKKDMHLTVAATIALINFVGILEEKWYNKG